MTMLATGGAMASTRVKRAAAGIPGLTVLSAAILLVLELLGTVGSGYTAGWGDHFVLSPEGISWADPTAFKGDWFLQAAPQPHWFFDIVTFVGEATGTLSGVYLLYWLAGIVAFGVGTALLAREVSSRGAWRVVVIVSVITGLLPWSLGGTGTLVIAQALPAVLSACLVYLLISAVLTRRLLLASAVAPVVAVIHVQQGSIAFILMAAVTITASARERRVPLVLLASLLATGAAVAFGLVLRPVASNLGDFVRICDEIIPYHCAAHLWQWNELLSAIGLVVLTALSALTLPRSERWRWWSTVGLATVGYGGGFAVDALHLPVLGPLAQGVNVYRLAAVLVPFAVWGLVSAALPGRHRGQLLVAAIALGGWLAVLTGPGWNTLMLPRVLLLGSVVLLGLIVTIIGRRAPGRARRVTDGALLPVLAGAMIVVAAVTGALALQRPVTAFIGDPSLRQWGAQVRTAVPSGAVIVSSPRFEWAKVVTRRAVVADCKDIPYGGVAWTEWQKRIDDLGGVSQCVPGGALLYNALSPAELVAVADQYGSDFIMVDPFEFETIDGLEDLGWRRAVEIVDGFGALLLERSSPPVGVTAPS